MNEHSNNNNAGNPSVRKVPATRIRENDNDRGEDNDDNGMLIDLERNKRKKKDTIVSSTISKNKETTAACSTRNASFLVFPSNNNDILVPVILSISSYLVPREVLNCIQTCQVWNTKFDTSAVWCAAAQNSASPFVVGAIQTAARARAQREDAKSMLSNRNISLAVSKTGETDFRNFKDEGGEGGEPQSKLQLKDYLLVMEIRDRETKNHIATCCRDLSEMNEPRTHMASISKLRQLRISPPIKDSQQERFTTIVVPAKDLTSLTGEQEDDNGDEIYDFYDVYQRWELTSRLIRCDTGTSVCINDNTSYYDTAENSKRTCYFATTEIQPNAANLAGIIASGICYRHEYNFVQFDHDISLHPLSKFEFTIKEIIIGLRVSVGEDECANDDFKSTNHLLLWLEGLDWK